MLTGNDSEEFDVVICVAAGLDVLKPARKQELKNRRGVIVWRAQLCFRHIFQVDLAGCPWKSETDRHYACKPQKVLLTATKLHALWFSRTFPEGQLDVSTTSTSIAKIQS
jgi:hypothetical protein